MNHLVQIARRSNKEAIGFKVQLVVHRFSASLGSLQGAELLAVMTGHKKRAATKSAQYSLAQKEVVWGDILPFSSTLYMAKTGLFQAKLFAVHVLDAATQQQVAAFEFNLAELVSAVKDSGKESITIATTKCQDPRASISITVFSSRVVLRRGPSGRAEHDQLEASMDDDLRSDFSVCTIESRTSTTSAHQRAGRSPPSPTKYDASATSDSPTGDDKADGLRAPMTLPGSSVNATAAGDRQGFHHDAAEMETLRRKNQELVSALQDLETQLRQSEVANVKLEAANELKDEEIRQLRDVNADLERQIQQLRDRTDMSEDQRASADDGVMQVDFVQFMTIKEELEAARTELDALRSKAADQSSGVSERTSSAEEEAKEADEREEDRNSEDEYVDAQEPQLVAEISELKHSLAVLREEGNGDKAAIRTLTTANELLRAQVAALVAQAEALQDELSRKDGEITRLERATTHVNEVNSESEEEIREREARRRVETDAKIQNDRLVSQLHQLDATVTVLKEEKVGLMIKLEKAETANERAREEAQAAKSVLVEIEGEKEGLEEKLQSSRQAHEQAKQELVEAEQSIEELRQQVKEIAEQLQSAQQQLDSLRNDELAASAAATAAAVAKSQDLQDRWDELRSQNEQLQTRVDELEAQLESEQAEGEARESELQTRVATLRAETETLREELEQLCANKQAAEEELLARTEELREALESQRRLTVDCDERVGALEMTAEEMRARAGAQDQAAEEYQQRVKQLEQENDYFQRELIDSKLKLAELTQQNDELSQLHKKVEKNLLELQISVAEKNLKSKKK